MRAAYTKSYYVLFFAGKTFAACSPAFLSASDACYVIIMTISVVAHKSGGCGGSLRVTATTTAADQQRSLSARLYGQHKLSARKSAATTRPHHAPGSQRLFVLWPGDARALQSETIEKTVVKLTYGAVREGESVRVGGNDRIAYNCESSSALLAGQRDGWFGRLGWRIIYYLC